MKNKEIYDFDWLNLEGRGWYSEGFKYGSSFDSRVRSALAKLEDLEKKRTGTAYPLMFIFPISVLLQIEEEQKGDE